MDRQEYHSAALVNRRIDRRLGDQLVVITARHVGILVEDECRLYDVLTIPLISAGRRDS